MGIHSGLHHVHGRVLQLHSQSVPVFSSLSARYYSLLAIYNNILIRNDFNILLLQPVYV